jgi:hypothetical protein
MLIFARGREEEDITAGQEFTVRGVTVSTARWGKITESTTYVFDYQLLPKLWGEEEPQS